MQHCVPDIIKIYIIDVHARKTFICSILLCCRLKVDCRAGSKMTASVSSRYCIKISDFARVEMSRLKVYMFMLPIL